MRSLVALLPALLPLTAARAKSGHRPSAAFQFSLRTLLGLTVLVAVWCQAFLDPVSLWPSVIFALTLVVLLAALLQAIFRPAAARAFWLGFVVFGWTYLLLVLWPTPQEAKFSWKDQFVHQLLTTRLLWLGYNELSPQMPNLSPVPRFREILAAMESPSCTSFILVGQCLWTLLLGLLGGHVAQYLYLTREKEP